MHIGIFLLSEHNGDSSPGSQVRIQCDKIEEYNKELLLKDYKYSRPGVEDSRGAVRK